MAKTEIEPAFEKLEAAKSAYLWLSLDTFGHLGPLLDHTLP